MLPFGGGGSELQTPPGLPYPSNLGAQRQAAGKAGRGQGGRTAPQGLTEPPQKGVGPPLPPSPVASPTTRSACSWHALPSPCRGGSRGGEEKQQPSSGEGARVAQRPPGTFSHSTGPLWPAAARALFPTVLLPVGVGRRRGLHLGAGTTGHVGAGGEGVCGATGWGCKKDRVSTPP